MAHIALIIAPDVFRDEELFETQEELEAAGHQTTVVSTRPGTCTGKLGGTATATQAINDLNVADVDAVAFIGGMGSSVYFDHPEANRVAQECVAADKPLAAICLAPMILARGGFLKGKKVSVTDGESEAIGAYGADYQGQGVVQDGLIITANGPEASREFGRAIAAAL